MIQTASGIALILFIVCIVLPVCGLAMFWLSGLFRDH